MWTIRALVMAFATISFAYVAQAQEGAISAELEPAAPPPVRKWSASYAYYRYQMEGTSTANTGIYKFGDALTEVQLFSLSYQATAKWTLMAYLPYIKNVVETVYEPVPGGFNMKLTDNVSGLGDVRLLAMNMALAKNKHLGFYDIGFTLPTGATDKRFPSVTTGQNASYNMQPGSGTFDVVGGLTYLHMTTPKWTQNARLQYTARTGRTAKGYSLGDEVQTLLSTKYQALSFLNTGVQFSYKNRGSVNGKDQRYERFNNWNRPGIAAGDGHQYYHDNQINYDLSALVKAEYKTRWAQTLALEAGIPLWQDAINRDDIRLDTRYWVSASVAAAF